MEYRRLGRTDLKVSSIGLGCVTFGREIDRDASLAVLDHALERGINVFDTAPVYGEGSSEAILGEWMADRGVRDRVVISTKASLPLEREAILASAEESLRRLRVEQVEILKLHTWTDDTPLEEMLGALDTLVKTGKVRYIGCSNYDGAQLAQALQRQSELGYDRMEVVQPMYNLAHREVEEDLLPLCAKEEVGIISYSPLGAGFLAGKYRAQGPVPEGTRFDIKPGHQDIYFGDRGFEVVERLRAKSEEIGLSMVQLALSWVFDHQTWETVLVGGRRPDHVDQAFEAEARKLDPELLAELDAM